MDKTKTIEDLRQAVDWLSKFMFNIYVEWYASLRSPLIESERMAINMYRMMIFKAKSICQMSTGIIVIPTQKGIIPDPSTMYPILRSIYETLFLFRCIFVSSKNDTERGLLLNIWKIRGNNNLIQIPDDELDEETRYIKKSKKAENNELRKGIRELANRLSLSPTIIDNIENCINNNSPALKGFTFEHCEHCGSITAFHDLNFSDRKISSSLSDISYIYTHYSAHSHPSYIGVKHFEKMYYSKAEDNFMREVLEGTLIYICRFMDDFCKYKESYRLFYGQRRSDIDAALRVFDCTFDKPKQN